MSTAIWMEDSPEFDPSRPNASLTEEDESALENAAAARAEAYLKQVEKLDRRIDQKIRAREKLQEIAVRITRLPSALPGRSGEPMSSVTDRLIDLEREIDRDVDHLYNLKNEIWNVLSRMENQDIALMLDDKYLAGYSVQQVADRAGYCRRHAQRLIRWGLLEVDRILCENQIMRGYVPPMA